MLYVGLQKLSKVGADRRAARWESRAEHLWRERFIAYRQFVEAYALAAKDLSLSTDIVTKHIFADRVANLNAAHIQLTHIGSKEAAIAAAPVVDIFTRRSIKAGNVDGFLKNVGPLLPPMFDAMRNDIKVDELDEKCEQLF